MNGADRPKPVAPEAERIVVLQALRAFAALAVLLLHAGHAADKYGGPMPLIGLTDLGRVGVDLFFVLSGFIILHTAYGRGRSFRDFAIARWRRIYLPYLPVGLIMAFFTFVWTPHEHLNLRSWLASVTLLPVGEPALIVAWTLQHEVVFYGFVTLALLCGWWRTGLLVWIAAILAFGLSGRTAPVGLQPIDGEFLMGVAAWAAWKSGHRRTMLATSAALCLLAAALALAGPGLAIEGLAVERSGLIAVAAIFAAGLHWLVRADQERRIRTPRFLRFLGDASYSIYLIHALPLLVLAKPLAGSGWWVIFPVIAGAGLAAGIAYHLLVERPLLRWKAASRPRSTRSELA